MKPYCSLIFTLVLAVTLGIAQADTSKTKPQTPSVNKVISPTPIPANTSQTKKTKKELWPRTFVPSEKITADSVVSFPADI